MALGIGAVGGSAVTAFEQKDAARYSALTAAVEAAAAKVASTVLTRGTVSCALPAMHCQLILTCSAALIVCILYQFTSCQDS